MKKSFLIFGIVIIVINLFAFSFMSWYYFQFDKYSSIYYPETLEELQQRITEARIVPVLGDNVELEHITIIYNVSPAYNEFEDVNKYQDRIKVYFVKTDKFTIQVSFDNKGMKSSS